MATVGAFIIALSMLVFAWNILRSWRAHKANPVEPGPDPWDARSLEWMTASPVPTHNFDSVPTVSHLDEFWHRKYAEDDTGRVVRVAASEDVAQKGDAKNVHLPSPSYWPIVLAAGLPLIGYGLMFHLGFAALGGAVVLLAAYGWGLEPADDPEAGHGHGHDDDHGHGDDGDGDDHDGNGSGDGESVDAVPAAVTAGDTADEEGKPNE